MKKILYTILIAITIFSCKEQTPEPEKTVEKQLIVSQESELSNYTVQLYSEHDTLFEGFNELFFKVVKDGSEISDATLTLHPLMDMMTKVHAAPYENPEFEDGYYKGAVVFIMPSMDMMNWTVDVAINDGGTLDTVKFTIPKVKTLEEVKKIRVASKIDSTIYFISLVSPLQPTVGVNEFTVTAHYKKSMMEFPADEDLTFEIEPEMPDMDHGSPNNVDPVHIANGHYEGKVNFTMTGYWKVNLTIKKNGNLVSDDAYFDITFQ